MKRAVGGAAHSLAWIPASIQKIGLLEVTSTWETDCCRPNCCLPTDEALGLPILTILSGLPSDDLPMISVDAKFGKLDTSESRNELMD